MIHYLRTIRSQREGFDELAELAADSEDLYNDQLELNFSRCGFFDANMAAALAAILARVADQFNAIEIVKVPPPIASILRKNGFLVPYGYRQLGDVNHTTVPFIRVQLSDKRKSVV